MLTVYFMHFDPMRKWSGFAESFMWRCIFIRSKHLKHHKRSKNVTKISANFNNFNWILISVNRSKNWWIFRACESMVQFHEKCLMNMVFVRERKGGGRAIERRREKMEGWTIFDDDAKMVTTIVWIYHILVILNFINSMYSLFNYSTLKPICTFSDNFIVSRVAFTMWSIRYLRPNFIFSIMVFFVPLFNE